MTMTNGTIVIFNITALAIHQFSSEDINHDEATDMYIGCPSTVAAKMTYFMFLYSSTIKTVFISYLHVYTPVAYTSVTLFKFKKKHY